MPETTIATDQADPAPTLPAGDPNQGTKVTWDDSRMITTFANVVNVLATREEMSLLLGTNQTWNASETRELTVQLSNRIVLTPFAAKRLPLLLGARVREYESHYGQLQL